MARAMHPNLPPEASSLCMRMPASDGQYAAFGMVTEGMDVVTLSLKSAQIMFIVP